MSEDYDRAEQGLLESVEKRKISERPPLPNVPFQKLYSAWNDEGSGTTNRNRRSKKEMDATTDDAADDDNDNDNNNNSKNNHEKSEIPPAPPPPIDSHDSASKGSLGGNKSRLSVNNNNNNNNNNSRGSRGSRASLLSRERGSRNLNHGPNYAEIAQRMRRISNVNAAANAFLAAANISSSTNHPSLKSDNNNNNDNNDNQSSTSKVTPPSTIIHTTTSSTNSGNLHRRHPSRAHALLEAIQERSSKGESFDTGFEHLHHTRRTSSSANIFFDGVSAPGASNDVGESALAMESTNTDQLIAGAMQVERLFRSEREEAMLQQEEEAELYPEVNASQYVAMDDDPYGAEEEAAGAATTTGGAATIDDELQPLTGSTLSYGTSPMNPGIAHERREALKHRRRKMKMTCWDYMKWHFSPRHLFAQFCLLTMSSYAVKVCMPLTIMSYIFFTWLSDPSPEFLPGQASVSWWLLFVARQSLTLDLARLSQWLLIDCLILSSRVAVRALGPLSTLVAIQSKGWPFCAMTWSIIDLFALHGAQHFQQHWLFWTGIPLFAYGDTGVYLLNSTIYLQLLLAGIVASIATAAKRTLVALYFGHRTLVEFKPRLEKILREVIVLSEIAELAMEAEILEASTNNAKIDEKNRPTVESLRHTSRVQWSPSLGADGRQRVFSLDQKKSSSGGGDGNDSDSGSSGSGNDDDSDAANDEDDDNDLINGRDQQSYRSSSTEILYLLDDWQEPRNAMDKTPSTSINDILKFRRALSFIDDSQPFGGAFGPAHNREAVIRSAESAFRRLMTLAPGNDVLPFDALEMLAQSDGDGPVDRTKLRTIKRMFRPDKDNTLTLLHFVKGCDSIYRKLRFFRASVGNASVIDHHLESIIDGAFYFVLTLVILTMTGLNPWPLLVSLSTLLVSISFAVGSSASQYIEGVLLIAVRRPFDLGDRIFMMDPSVINSDDGIMVSWFVEDINLFNTTIRYAATNETATISNGAIANMRITNGNRSANAIVWFTLPFRSRILREGRFDEFRSFLEQYAKDHPRQWHSYSYCRFDTINAEKDKLVATIGFQHRSSWQDLAGILTAKADLVCTVLEYSKRHGIIYEELPTRTLNYFAGRLKQGGYTDDQHRDKLHQVENISNHDILQLGNASTESTAKEETMQSNANDTFLAHLQKSHF